MSLHRLPPVRRDTKLFNPRFTIYRLRFRFAFRPMLFNRPVVFGPETVAWFRSSVLAFSHVQGNGNDSYQNHRDCESNQFGIYQIDIH
jgi:hypothetical protein